MTIEKEIEFLSLYLNFLKENTKTDFTYLFEVDSNLDVRNCCVPALLLQPFIESIVRKGFKDLGKTGTITIYFQIRNLTELRIVIEDNGRGLKSIDSIRATEIINDRLFLLNKLNKTNASFFIRERVSGGVSVEVYLPIITKAFAEGLTLED
jgi:LytS/YehU family sensor histidine kinase